MKKSKFIRIVFIALILLVLCFKVYNVKAFNPGQYDVTGLSRDEASTLFKMGDNAYGVLLNIATIVSILTIAVIGIKFMFGSVEQRAEYKASLLPWVIGASVVFGITRIISLIQNLSTKI